MKKLIIFLSLFGLLLSCIRYSPDYTYIYDIKVTYENGDADTIHYEKNSFKGNPVHIFIKTSDGGVLSSSGGSPCLASSCGLYTQVLVCGVRKFEIINESKKGPLPDKSWEK